MWVIKDCNKVIVGNKSGYKSYKSAEGQINRDKSPAALALKKSYFAKYGNEVQDITIEVVSRVFCNIVEI